MPNWYRRANWEYKMQPEDNYVSFAHPESTDDNKWGEIYAWMIHNGKLLVRQTNKDAPGHSTIYDDLLDSGFLWGMMGRYVPSQNAASISIPNGREEEGINALLMLEEKFGSDLNVYVSFQYSTLQKHSIQSLVKLLHQKMRSE